MEALTGDVINVAAKLADAAAVNEIVVGTLAGRLVDHAAVLEHLRELDIGVGRGGVRASRVVEIAPAARLRTEGGRAVRRTEASSHNATSRAGRLPGRERRRRARRNRPLPEEVPQLEARTLSTDTHDLVSQLPDDSRARSVPGSVRSCPHKRRLRTLAPASLFVTHTSAVAD